MNTTSRKKWKLKHKLHSIFFNKCPRCHAGRFWSSNNPYHVFFIDGGKLYEHCPNCGQRYFLEVGFYYGAMMVSYALNALLFIAGLVAVFTLTPMEWSNWIHVAVVAVPMLLVAPVIYFLSRLIWINFFVHFDEDVAFTVHRDIAPPKLVSKT